MSDTREKVIVTLLLDPPTADGVRQRGSLSIKQGDLAHLSQFEYEGLRDIALAIQDGFSKLAEVVANPPQVETAPEVKAPAGKGPYHLRQQGKRRKLDILDPFAVQERCMKNKALKFQHLVEAREIATLLANGTGAALTICYSNGRECETVTPAESGSAG